MRTSRRMLILTLFGVLCAGLANAARGMIAAGVSESTRTGFSNFVVAWLRVKPADKPFPWMLDPSKDVRRPEVAKQFEVSLDEVREHMTNADAAFVDARRPDQYAEGHLAGAYNVPSDDKETYMAAVYENVPQDQRVIIYCDGGECEASHSVFDHLRDSGFTNLKIFPPGWEVLGTTDLPIETGAAAAPDAEAGMTDESYVAPGDDATTSEEEGAPLEDESPPGDAQSESGDQP